MFFFFKQKTAYEMLRSLVGSEMCIRDSPGVFLPKVALLHSKLVVLRLSDEVAQSRFNSHRCQSPDLFEIISILTRLSTAINVEAK